MRVPCRPKMTKSKNHDFAAIFDAQAQNYDMLCLPYAVARRREFALSYAKGRILEVGAASGGIGAALQGQGEVMICDISFEMCREANSKRGLASVCCDAEVLPFASSSFDTVIAAEMVYYLNEPEAFVREARRVLKPGGRLLMTSYNQDMIWIEKLRSVLRFIGISKTYFDDGIREFLPLGTLKSLAAKHGFENLSVEKMILIPSGACDSLNRILEKTPLKHLGLFWTLVCERGFS